MRISGADPRVASRRGVVHAGIGLIAAALVRPGIARAQSDFDWRRFKGQKIEVAYQRSVVADDLFKYHSEFTDLTGITVAAEQIPEQQYRQKLVMQFSSANPGLDVCYIALTSQKRLFGKAKWLEDLRPLIANPSVTAPDFDFGDFNPASIAYSTQTDGRMDTMPVSAAYNVLMWNKELFAAKDLAPPTDLPGVLEAARKLHDSKNGISGFVARGLKNANVPVWTSFLLAHGIDAIGRDATVHTDGPDSIAAATLYQTLNRDYGPPGVSGFNWNECLSTFMQGRAAMFLDTTTVAQPVGDPARSRIAGKVGFSVMPTGPGAPVAPMFGDGLGISTRSSRKEAAWLYVQWAANKTNQRRQLLVGAGAPSRRSGFDGVAESPDFKAPLDWLRVVQASSPIAHPCLPEIVAINEFRDVFGIALANMLGSADPAAELQRATQQFQPVLTRTESQ